MLQHTSSEVINIQLQIPVNSFPEHPKNQVFFPLHKKKTSSGQKLCTEQTAGIAMISIQGKQNADYITEKQNILNITKQLRSCINNFYGIFNLKIVFQNTRRIKSFYPNKDKLAPSFRSKVVYRETAGIAMISL